MIARIALSVFLAAALTFSASSALAADEADDLNRLGFYIQGNGFWAHNNFYSQLQDVTGGNVNGEDGAGMNVRGGYQFLTWLAVEAMYEYATELDANVAGAKNGFTVDTHSLLANVKLTLPVYWMQPYVVLGIGGQRAKFDSKVVNPWVSDQKEWNFVGRPGIGVDFLVTDRWTINFEAAGMLAMSDYRASGGSLDRLFYTAVGGGIRYRF